MGTSREVTERQLQQAKQTLQERTAALEKSGIDRAGMKRDPEWRHLDAQVRQVSARLRKIGQVEALNQEVAQRKAAKLAGEPEGEAAEEAPEPTQKRAKGKAKAAGK